ncbi:MAG: DUF1847 domain-containing protein [Anaerovoracaceae bacterium]|jgi:uncharacterized metal-binding protein
MTEDKSCFTCVDCGALHCEKRNSAFPEFCLTTKLTEEDLSEIKELYQDPENRRIAAVSAEIESDYYGRYTRVEEIMEFARRMGYHKIGLATCAGLIRESRIFTRILRRHGFEVYGVVCKVGSIDKDKVGVPKDKQKTGPVMCNPILQARLLNKEKTDLNVVIGLCVGHDSLFYKYSQSVTTTLVTKDRVLAHNPCAALYQAESYYKRLLQDD